MKTLDLLVDLQRDTATKVEDGFKSVNISLLTIHDAMSAHALDDMKRFASLEQKIQPIESMRRTVRWATGVTFAAFVGLVLDLLLRR